MTKCYCGYELHTASWWCSIVIGSNRNVVSDWYEDLHGGMVLYALFMLMAVVVTRVLYTYVAIVNCYY